jgi:large subunit ribosomal protein L19
MTNNIIFNKTEFGVGDKIRITQIIKDKEKERNQIFEGILIAIKGNKDNKTITVRKVGEQKIGIERIFPIGMTNIKEIRVMRKGLYGAKKSKLYYIRNKSKKEIEDIYRRSSKRSSK